MEEYLRKSTNILLLKDDLGKAKPSSYPLPGPDFAFGKSVGNDAEGAKEVVGSWNFHRPSKPHALKRDFKSLNKLTVKLGASTSKDVSQLRKTNDAWLPRKEPQKAIKVVLPEEDFSYGMPNRPSTPINSVLCKSGHQYGEQATNIINDIYKARLEEQGRKSSTLPKITKAVKLVSETSKQKLNELNNTTQKPLFKMKRFQNISFKVDNLNHKYIKERSLVGSAHQDRVRSVERVNT